MEKEIKHKLNCNPSKRKLKLIAPIIGFECQECGERYIFDHKSTDPMCECCPRLYENNFYITGYTMTVNGELISITISHDGCQNILKK